MKVSLLKEMYCFDIVERIQLQPQSGAVVGDDGELLQPDMTAYPDYYTYYEVPIVHRDALLLGILDNIRENGFAYLLLSPMTLVGTVIVALIPVALIILFVDGSDNYRSNFIATMTVLGLGCIVSFLGYLAMRLRNYFR